MLHYTDAILDHYENPRNAGEMPAPDAVGAVENAACGDVLKLFRHIESGQIAHATFQTLGCPPAIAASSVLTEMLRGATLEEAQEARREDIAAAMGGRPPTKQHCAVLAQDALQAAIQDYRSGLGSA